MASSSSARDVEATIRGVVEPLAELTRRAGSPGERRAAEMLVEAFARAGAPAHIEEVPFRDGYARLLMPLAAVGLVVGVRSSGGRRRPLSALLAGAAVAALVDDVENGMRPWRRAVARLRPTWNVVAEVGDPDADRTLAIMAHHDAAPTGRVFDPSLQRWLARRFPGFIQRTNTGVPVWWPAAAGPGLAALGAATGSRRLARAGAAVAALNVVLAADVARSRTVPGAHDALTGGGA